MTDAARSGHLSGDGEYTARCHALLQQMVGARKVLLTTSCTHALEMSALLLNVREGDEIILPSFTFVSTANAFVLRGARPVFADVRPDTLNLDEKQLDSLVTAKTKAVVVVHYAGIGCEMDPIRDVATRRSLAIVEDNAHGLLGTYRGRQLGTFGCLAAQSFHETKNFSCGEGGALVINDPDLIDRAEILREKGTNRSLFFKRLVDKYTWVDVGSSYLPSDLLAAFLYAQLEAREIIQGRRRRAWEHYANGLRDWAAKHDATLPNVPEHCVHPSHIFYLLLPTERARDGLMAHLRERGIGSAFHYLPLHLSEMGRRLGGQLGQCPVTEDVAGRLLRLPLHASLTTDDVALVVAAIEDWSAC
jgi:dTDP-4-amino-4,6-dideoxygalactose transaminase